MHELVEWKKGVNPVKMHWKLEKIGENWRNLEKIGKVLENWINFAKIGEILRKLEKIEIGKEYKHAWMWTPKRIGSKGNLILADIPWSQKGGGLD